MSISCGSTLGKERNERPAGSWQLVGMLAWPAPPFHGPRHIASASSLVRAAQVALLQTLLHTWEAAKVEGKSVALVAGDA